MDYEKLEIEISELFNGCFFEAKPLPDTQAEFVQNVKPRVYVMYENSDYDDPENLSTIIQEDKINIGIEMHAATRRGDKGIFAIQKKVYEILLGYKYKGCDRFKLVSFGPIQGNTPNKWMYYARFATVSHISQANNDIDIELGPSLKNVTIVKDENIH